MQVAEDSGISMAALFDLFTNLHFVAAFIIISTKSKKL
ncbi:unnamed protein product [Acidithrix sp. C25]|nr:unnamed protein product [Acidithrix sp. C25]